MKRWSNVLVFLFGLNFMAMGIALYLKTNIGVSSWDALYYNFYDFYGLTVGTWVFILGIIIILISQLVYFKPIHFFAIITGLIQGWLIDLWFERIYVFTLTNLPLRYLLFIVSLFILGNGIALVILSKLPPTTGDVFMVSLQKRFRLNQFASKTLADFIAFVVTVIITFINHKPFNYIGIGTILSLSLIGSIVQIATNYWKKILSFLDK